MKALLAVVVIITSTCFGSQTGDSVPSKDQIRLDESKPTVYISFKELLPSESEGINSQSGEKLRLELHNNTRWTIYYYTLPKKAEAGDSPILYKVETRSQDVAQGRIGDVIIANPLSSGKSASFTVPREYLAKGNKIFIEFYYKWESRAGYAPSGTEPHHRAYFSHGRLPGDLRK